MNINKQPSSNNKGDRPAVDPSIVHRERVKFGKTVDHIKSDRHLATKALNPEAVNQGPKRVTREEFAGYADKLSRRTADRDEKFHSSILATLPAMIEAQKTLEHDNKNSTTYDEREVAVLKAIAFNDAMRDAIEANPRLEAGLITTVVQSACQFYNYSAQEMNDIVRQTTDTLRGMQHELAFESVLWNLPEGFEVLETTAEDDARGADYRVLCPNGVTVSIDVKASQAAADRAYDKRGHKMAQNEIVLYSGFTKEDFDTEYPWRPTYEATQSLTPYVEEELRIASGEDMPPHTTDIVNK